MAGSTNWGSVYGVLATRAYCLGFVLGPLELWKLVIFGPTSAPEGVRSVLPCSPKNLIASTYKKHAKTEAVVVILRTELFNAYGLGWQLSTCNFLQSCQAGLLTLCELEDATNQ